MDSVTITKTALDIRKSCRDLIKFMTSVAQAGEIIGVLCKDLELLDGNIESICQFFFAPEFICTARTIQREYDSPIFTELQRNLTKCAITIQQLNDVMTKISRGENRNFLTKALTQRRLEERDENPLRLRWRVEICRDSTQIFSSVFQLCKQVEPDDRAGQALDAINQTTEELSKYLRDQSSQILKWRTAIESGQVIDRKIYEEEIRLLKDAEEVVTTSLHLGKTTMITAARRSSVACTEKNISPAYLWETGITLSSIRNKEAERCFPHQIPEQEHENPATSNGDPQGVSAHRRTPADQHRLSSNPELQKNANVQRVVYSPTPASAFSERPSILPTTSDPSIGKDTAESKSISFAEFNHAMTVEVASAEARKKDSKKPFKEVDFTNISRLLRQIGKSQWSERPRTYLVLRLIDQVQALNGFVVEDL
ncbi:hypothetical protein MMC25_006673 [Agyrium rufum]|nr:hypothetical protein [Agyrium rufum]